LGIIKYQERVFLGRGRAFSMRILQQTPAITNKKTELKGDNHAWLSGSVRERQGASKRVHFLISPSLEIRLILRERQRNIRFLIFFPVL
jgi:hypothetical protein